MECLYHNKMLLIVFMIGLSVCVLAEGYSITSLNEDGAEMQIELRGKKINESCTTLFDCQGKLLCYSGICQCSFDHFWNGTNCIMKKLVHEPCDSSAECQETLLCNNTCICDNAAYWAGSKCQKKQTVNAMCNSTEQCQQTLYCARQVCQCPGTDYWNGSSCALRKGLNVRCTSTTECKETLQCDGRICTCCSSDYWNGTLCVKKKTVNAGCDKSVECDTEFVCYNKMCKCPASDFWDGHKCLKRKNISSNCTSDQECQETLQCTERRCQCRDSDYWTQSACIHKKDIDSSCISSLECKDEMECINYRCSCKLPYYWNGMVCQKDEPHECEDILSDKDGIYSIVPKGSSRQISVYCIMEKTKKWTVIQRRFDGSLDFSRPWKDFKSGFGFTTGEHWLGNDNICLITQHGGHELSVYLEDWERNIYYANYSSFSIGNESTKYLLSISGYSGNIDDAIENYHNGQKFSTYDNDNDQNGGNCAAYYNQTSWWYNNCHPFAQVNGQYNVSKHWNGFVWKHKSNMKSLKNSLLLVRRK